MQVRDRTTHGLNHSPGDLLASMKRSSMTGVGTLKHLMRRSLRLPQSVIDALDKALSPTFEDLEPGYLQAKNDSTLFDLLEAESKRRSVLAKDLKQWSRQYQAGMDEEEWATKSARVLRLVTAGKSEQG